MILWKMVYWRRNCLLRFPLLLRNHNVGGEQSFWITLEITLLFVFISTIFIKKGISQKKSIDKNNNYK